MKDLIKKEINKEKILKISTAILLFLAMFIYEVIFCNAKFAKGILTGEIVNYNFSLVRLVVYAIYGFLYFKYIDRFTKDAVESFKNKFKLIAIAAIVILFGGIFVYSIKIGMIKYKLVLLVLDFLLGIVLVTFLSNNFKKNMIVLFATLGILFCCTTQFNGSLDETRHFMTAFNVSIGNFDYRHLNKSEESMAEIPHVCPLVDSMQFFEKKYQNNVYEANDVAIDLRSTTYSFLLYLPAAIGIKIGTILQGSVADIYILRKNI